MNEPNEYIIIPAAGHPFYFTVDDDRAARIEARRLGGVAIHGVIDCIAKSGAIRMHVLRPGEPKGTLCGIVVGMSQAPAGNGMCLRCARIVRKAIRAVGSSK